MIEYDDLLLFELRGDELKILNETKKYIPTEREDIWSWICYFEKSIKDMEFIKRLANGRKL